MAVILKVEPGIQNANNYKAQMRFVGKDCITVYELGYFGNQLTADYAMARLLSFCRDEGEPAMIRELFKMVENHHIQFFTMNEEKEDGKIL